MVRGDRAAVRPLTKRPVEALRETLRPIWVSSFLGLGAAHPS